LLATKEVVNILLDLEALEGSVDLMNVESGLKEVRSQHGLSDGSEMIRHIEG
jgi:hypothetical protein